MNHPNPHIDAVRERLLNPQTPSCTTTRVAPLEQNQSHYVQRQSCRSAFFPNESATLQTFSGYTYSDFALSIVFATLICLAALASATTPASAQAANFGSINVCPAGTTTPAPCSATQTLTFNVPADTTIYSIAILTTGLPGLDFTAKADDTSTTLCKVQHYSSATTCTLDVTFAPLAAGARNGAVELLDGKRVVALTYVYGLGVGPQVAFGPSIPEPLVQQAPTPIYSLAVDAGANIFVISNNNYDLDTVQEFLSADGYTTSKTLFSGIPGERPIALDGAGNIFFGGLLANNGAGVTELVAASGYAPKGIAIPNCCGTPAVDGSGNLFVGASQSASGPPQVEELFASSNYKTGRFMGTGLHGVYTLFLDAADNVFIQDLDDSGENPTMTIMEIVAASGYTTTKTLDAKVFLNSSLFGLDAASNVYYAAESAPGIIGVYESLAAGGYTTVENLYYGAPVACCNPLVPFAGALDSSGNLYLISSRSYSTSPIFKLPRSQAPAFDFGATVVGDISSPLSTTLQNIGNATLTGSLALTDTADFSLVAGSGKPADCTSSFSLASGVTCDISIDFTPRSTGPLTAEAVLTDNALNATDATQSIALSGIGTTVEVSPATLDFGSIPYPNTATQTLTVTNTGTTTLTVDPSSNGRGAVITATTCGAGVGGGDSCTLQVEFKPVELGLNHDTITIQTNAASDPEVPVSGTATGVGTQTTTLDFGTVKGRGNTSTLDLEVASYGVPGNTPVKTETGATTFKVIESTCTDPGPSETADCYIFVTFAPVEANVPETAYLKLIPSTGPTQTIKLTGTLVP